MLWQGSDRGGIELRVIFFLGDGRRRLPDVLRRRSNGHRLRESGGSSIGTLVRARPAGGTLQRPIKNANRAPGYGRTHTKRHGLFEFPALSGNHRQFIRHTDQFRPQPREFLTPALVTFSLAGRRTVELARFCLILNHMQRPGAIRATTSLRNCRNTTRHLLRIGADIALHSRANVDATPQANQDTAHQPRPRGCRPTKTNANATSAA
ncbi:hypothetical protein LMG3410_00749 [Achromobacter aegrifaciens]|nr:hypothetical protein LMG3410_00749 [Achromobacter aegrifaciens]